MALQVPSDPLPASVLLALVLAMNSAITPVLDVWQEDLIKLFIGYCHRPPRILRSRMSAKLNLFTVLKAVH